MSKKTKSTPNPNCGCVIHPGQTHEEHMDQLDKQMNKEAWERSNKGELAFYAFCQAEERRLKEKLWNMEHGKIRIDSPVSKAKPNG